MVGERSFSQLISIDTIVIGTNEMVAMFASIKGSQVTLGVDGCHPTCASAAAPARITSIDRESVRQKPPDLERPGRGGRLHAPVGWRWCWRIGAIKSRFDLPRPVIEPPKDLHQSPASGGSVHQPQSHIGFAVRTMRRARAETR